MKNRTPRKNREKKNREHIILSTKDIQDICKTEFPKVRKEFIRNYKYNAKNIARFDKVVEELLGLTPKRKLAKR